MIEISHFILERTTNYVTKIKTISSLDSRSGRSNIHRRDQRQRGAHCSWYLKSFLDAIKINVQIVNDHVLPPWVNEGLHHRYPFLTKRFLVFSLGDALTLLPLIHVCDGILDATVLRSEYQSLVHRCKVVNKGSAGGAGDMVYNLYRTRRVISLSRCTQIVNIHNEICI